MFDNYKPVMNLIEEQKLKEAVELLNEIDFLDEEGNYLLGYCYYYGHERFAFSIFDSNVDTVLRDFFKNSDSLAKAIFLKLIEDGTTFPKVYVWYASMLSYRSEKEKKVRVLKKGIDNIGYHMSLVTSILEILEGDDLILFIESLPNDIKTLIEVRVFYVYGLFQAKKYNKVIEQWEPEFHNNTVMRYIYIVSNYELNNYKEASLFLTKSIEEDLGDKNEFINTILKTLSENKLGVSVSENASFIMRHRSDLSNSGEGERFFIDSEIEFAEGYSGKILIDYSDYVNMYIILLSDLFKSNEDLLFINIKRYYRFQSFNKTITNDYIKRIKKLDNPNIELKILLVNLYNQLSLSKNGIVDALLDVLYSWSNSPEDIDLEDIGTIIRDDDSKMRIYEAVKYVFHENKLFHYKERIIKDFIEYLYNENSFQLIADLYFINKDIDLCESFEVAFSLAKIQSIDYQNGAKEVYERLLLKDQKETSFYNNLGLIYLNFGTLESIQRAIELFEKGLTINKTHKNLNNNLKTAKEKLKKIVHEKNVYQQSLELVKKENTYIKNMLVKFNSHANDQGDIICSTKLLPKYLGVPEGMAYDKLKDLIDKGYVIKKVNHDYNTQANVYYINPLVAKYIDDYIRDNEAEEYYFKIAQNLNLSYIQDFGFDEPFRKKVLKRFGKGFGENVNRDIEETIISRITKQYKTTLVLCGSIIESILYHITQEHCKKNLITKIIVPFKNNPSKTKSIKVDEIQLSDMIEFLKLIHMLDSHILTGCDLLRGYRNLIHPGFEQRKKAYSVLHISEENADIAWKLVLQIIKSVI